MSRKFWRVPAFDKKQAAELAYEYGYDAMAVLLLAARGVTDPEDVADFLESEAELYDPFDLKDMEKAVVRIRKAIEMQEKIAVYGDYDADGVTATALLYLYLESVGADVSYYIPSRMNEGYGLHNDAIDTLAEKNINLIITVDNGINSVNEAAYIKSKGIDLIITDHHQPGGTLPDAVAVVNPHRADDTSFFKELAGVGVAFKLAAALEDGDCESILSDFADIVCIGTIADIVPLKSENRILAVRGIESINNSDRAGIVALKKIVGYEDRDFTSTNVAFTIAPRINAAGRVEEATTALRLLLTDDVDEAQAIAEELDKFNVMRQETESGIVDEAVARIESDESLKYSRVIVVDGTDWHAGVIGIVASKLVDRYGKPVMVIARDGSGEAKGSCRSIEGFSLFDALTDASDLLVRFGGHTLAAGFTVTDENIDAFRKRINDYASQMPPFYPVLNLDCRINPQSVDVDFVDSISCLEPFGAENPQPVFGIYNVILRSVRPIGAQGKHIRLTFEKKNQQFAAVYFGMTPEEFPYDAGDKIDLAVTIDKNEFRGEIKANIYIKAVRLSDFNDEEYFSSELLYNKVKQGVSLTESERLAACPDRKFSARVFMYIKSQPSCIKSAELIAIKTGSGSHDACKVQVVLDAFCELGLITYENGCYKAVENAAKVNLGSSELLKRLGYCD
ncbi:MAG: single-stranded-DNA-specific exonuclease RecJ [Clostridia bacterium]|nr:single-stranded-DNA-specific exonuclease RecJ [Clostridia bacterium]